MCSGKLVVVASLGLRHMSAGLFVLMERKMSGRGMSWLPVDVHAIDDDTIQIVGLEKRGINEEHIGMIVIDRSQLEPLAEGLLRLAGENVNAARRRFDGRPTVELETLLRHCLKSREDIHPSLCDAIIEYIGDSFDV